MNEGENHGPSFAGRILEVSLLRPGTGAHISYCLGKYRASHGRGERNTDKRALTATEYLISDVRKAATKSKMHEIYGKVR